MNRIVEDSDFVSYVSTSQMLDFLHYAKTARVWLFQGRPRAIRSGKYTLKNTMPFNGIDLPRFEAFLEKCFSMQIIPASLPGVWHSLFPTQLADRWGANYWARSFVSGAWIEALETGIVDARLWQYDLNSAYAWSASLGLPDMRTLWAWTSGRPKKNALLLADFCFNGNIAPYPFSPGWNNNIISAEELRMYPIDLVKIYAGVVWDRMLDIQRYVYETLDLFDERIAKQILRSFWGRFASTEPLGCAIFKAGKLETEWTCPKGKRLPLFYSALYAHLIVSRVKMKLWQVCEDAVRICVDSVVSRRTLETGAELGAFKLIESYAKGIDIRHAGRYTDMATGRVLKHSGEHFPHDVFEEVG